LKDSAKAIIIMRPAITGRKADVMPFEHACFVSYRHHEQSQLAERFIGYLIFPNLPRHHDAAARTCLARLGRARTRALFGRERVPPFPSAYLRNCA
jgi:hypothetical protein